MGLFDFGYNKPRKDIEKDDKEKHRIFIFFDVIFRKFMKFMQLNMLYLAFSIPYIALLYWFSPLNANTMSYIGLNGIGAFVQTLPQEDFSTFDFLLRSLFAFAMVILWGSGPASAGSAYIMRNFAREEHAWVFSDFWDSLKHNFCKSMIVLLVDIAVLYLSLTAFNFYSSLYILSENTIYLVAQGILAFILILYTFMHYYIYQLMVTYESSLKSLYKNCMLFAIAKFPQNILMTVLSFGILLGLYVLINVFAFMALILGFTIIFKFIIEFYSSDIIRKTADMQ